MSINDPHDLPSESVGITVPLRLAPPPSEPGERNRVLEIVRRATESAHGLLSRGLEFLSRFRLLVRAADWLTRARGWLSPATTVITRSGVALPVWLATTTVVQRVVVTVARRTGRTTRTIMLATAQLVQRGLSMTGQWGQRQAVKLSRAVERTDKALATFGTKAGRWVAALSANRPHVRVVRDVSLVVVVARQLRALVPPQWRIAVTGLSLLALGGQTRRWILNAARTVAALLRDLPNLFAAPSPVAATVNGTVPIRPGMPQRPNQQQHRRHH